jgi:hypothetical protein
MKATAKYIVDRGLLTVLPAWNTTGIVLEELVQLNVVRAGSRADNVIELPTWLVIKIHFTQLDRICQVISQTTITALGIIASTDARCVRVPQRSPLGSRRPRIQRRRKCGT